MVSEEAVEAARFRGTDAAKVSPRTGIPQLLPGARAVRAPSVLSLGEEECGRESWRMNFL